MKGPLGRLVRLLVPAVVCLGSGGSGTLKSNLIHGPLTSAAPRHKCQEAFIAGRGFEPLQGEQLSLRRDYPAWLRKVIVVAMFA
jgi:hypothetical protein